MKTNLPSRFLRCLFATGLSAAALAWAGEDGATATVKLSAPGKPATLRVDVPWADLHITGADGDAVTVVSSIQQKGAKETRDDGLRRLDDEVSFELTEHDNTVTLRIAGDNPWASHDAEFKIAVPRTMALDVKTEAGGDLTVDNIDGDIEVNNMNGQVRLEGISGSTVVNTMNGEVRATYAKAPQKLVSITSMNGEVDLRVPADTKANVRLRTHNGSILTDFSETVLKTKSEGRGTGYAGMPIASSTPDLMITIRLNGDYSLGNRSTPVSFDELTKAVADTVARDKSATVIIRSDEKADLKQVTAVMDACRKAGLNKIRLQSGYDAAFFDSDDMARFSADAARMAGEATRAAMQIAREVSREVKREVARAQKEADEENARAAAEEAKADKRAAEADASPAPKAPEAPVAATTPRAPRAPRPPIPAITGGKIVSGTLNGGGVDIKISTMNGEITLRQVK